MTDRTCPLGDDCDLTTAWMAGALDARRKMEADLNTAIAAAYEAAADRYAENDGDEWDYFGKAFDAIRDLTPADAIAARDADRARVRREALEEAANIASVAAKEATWNARHDGHTPTQRMRHSSEAATAVGIEHAIRAMIEEEGNG